MARASWNGRVLAESDETIEVEGNQYFPQEAVHMQYLQPSDNRTVCGWKGEASYYHVVVGGGHLRDAAWTYAEPKPEAEKLKGYVAFWKDIKVEI